MNKVYFYIFYIPIGAFLLFSIGPYLKNKKYKKDKISWSLWVKDHPLLESSYTGCHFCNKNENFEQVIFQLPKSVKKTLFSFVASCESDRFISVRCKYCQTEIGRKVM